MTSNPSRRQLGVALAVAFAVFLVQGCVGPAACGPHGGCGHSGPVIFENSCGDSCDGCSGERYVDEWLNHPPNRCDHCGEHNLVSDRAHQPLFHGHKSLWGYRCDPAPTGCNSPLCKHLDGRKGLCLPEGGCGEASCAGDGACDTGCEGCQHSGAISHSGPISYPGEEVVIGQPTSHYQPGMHLPSGSRPYTVMRGSEGGPVPAEFGGRSVMVPHASGHSTAPPEIVRTPAKVKAAEVPASKPIFRPRNAAAPRVGQASYQRSR